MKKPHVDRKTVDLSAYPDLVVNHLGMRVNTLTGLKTLFGTGRNIQDSLKVKTDGLLAHEMYLFSLFPDHLGIRQYWRDFHSPGSLGEVGATPNLVDRVFARYWRHWLLARDLFYARKHGSGV